MGDANGRADLELDPGGAADGSNLMDQTALFQSIPALCRRLMISPMDLGRVLDGKTTLVRWRGGNPLLRGVDVDRIVEEARAQERENWSPRAQPVGNEPVGNGK